MAGIGADIAEVMEELGDDAVIIRNSGNITEKILLDSNWSTTSSFVRDFMLNASFSYETVIVPGDIIQTRGSTYLVTDRIVDTFESEIVEYASAIFRCNITGNALFLTPTSSTNGSTFVTTLGWNIKKSNAYCLVYKNARNAINNINTVPGKDLTFELDCFVPTNYGIAPLDRLYISSTQYYRVQDVEDFAFSGISVLTLVEDDRIAYTPIVTP